MGVVAILERARARSRVSAGGRLAAPEPQRTVLPAATHLASLDGLRGAAMLLVFLNHAIAFPLEPVTNPLDGAVHAVAVVGWTALDLFFVLSGFLITGILLDTRGEPRRWSNFVARRALRVFPLYYAVLIGLFVLLPRIVHWSNPDFATLLANQRWYWSYTVNLLIGAHGVAATPLYTAHFWSLSIEEQFYLIWPLVVWTCSRRTLLRVAALIALAGFAFRLALVLHDPGHARAAYFLTPGRLDSLMMGGALAVWARSPGGLARFRTAAPWVFGTGAFALLLLGVLRDGLGTGDPVVAVVAYPLLAVVFGALLVMALTGSPFGRLGRALRSRALGKWGTYSYGIYILHLPLLGAIEQKMSFYRHGFALLGGSRLPGVLVLAIAEVTLSYQLGRLSYHLYEKRFLELKRYFSPRRPAPRASSARALLPPRSVSALQPEVRARGAD